MNDTEMSTTGGTVKPFGLRIAVVDPPAETQRPSGLFLPEGVDDLAVGIVVSNPVAEDPFLSPFAEGPHTEIKVLKPGVKIYYHKGHGTVIKDTRILPLECVIACEEV